MKEYRLQKKLMGCNFELVAGSDDKVFANQMLEAGVEEIKRIEEILSEFNPASVTSQINSASGIRSVEVPSEVYTLLQRSIKLSQFTQGAFDITTGALMEHYDFKNKSVQFPDSKSLEKSLEKTGFDQLHLLKNYRVYLAKRGMKISFASIGKGYAADSVKDLWAGKGLESGVINASGDLCVIGEKPDGSSWTVGIANPVNPSEMLVYLPLDTGAVATSGDYEQYFISGGKRYSHTLDPHIGLPVGGIKSVTVTGKSAELCDALATAVTVMGVETGLHFINQLPAIHCLIVDEANKIHFSKNITFEKTI